MVRGAAVAVTGLFGVGAAYVWRTRNNGIGFVRDAMRAVARTVGALRGAAVRATDAG